VEGDGAFYRFGFLKNTDVLTNDQQRTSPKVTDTTKSDMNITALYLHRSGGEVGQSLTGMQDGMGGFGSSPLPPPLSGGKGGEGAWDRRCLVGHRVRTGEVAGHPDQVSDWTGVRLVRWHKCRKARLPVAGPEHEAAHARRYRSLGVRRHRCFLDFARRTAGRALSSYSIVGLIPTFILRPK